MNDNELTVSIWGRPPDWYLAWVERVARLSHPRAAVLGCSDGKFVLPLARRGIRVAAIDYDRVALYGGQKTGRDGSPIVVEGLDWRLTRESLRHVVDIIDDDFLSRDPEPAPAVFCSGALHYSRNSHFTLKRITDILKAWVLPGGELLFEHMTPSTLEHRRRSNMGSQEAWEAMFRDPEWVLVDSVVSDPMPDTRSMAVRPRYEIAQWGRILARRTR
jgi:hypothetical protein